MAETTPPHRNDPLSMRCAVTYRYERLRAVAAGVLETAGGTFLLLIAVRHFEAGPTAKALIAMGVGMGMLLTPLVVSWITSLRWPAARGASVLAMIGGAGMLAAAAWPVLPVFLCGGVLGLVSGAASIPLLTQMYQENYPGSERGRLFSHTIVVRIAVAAAFSALAGRALTSHLQRFQALLVLYAAALFIQAWCLARCPSRPLAVGGGTHWLRSLRFVREDRLFRLTLISWMLMGFGNLMMMPLRVEYMANPRYGLALSAAAVAWLTGVIPNLARLIMSPVWGRLFDRLNFFLLRIVLNLGFVLGILAFYTGSGRTGLVVGSLIFGVSLAGGDVAWSLWVTKIAPPERVAEYMAVHTFFTGVRSLIAPLISFHLVGSGCPVHLLAMISAGFIVVASLLLLPEARLAPRRRPGTPLVEEVSE